MTGRIFLKLVLAVLCVVGVALTGVHFLASQAVQSAYQRQLRAELMDKARILSALPEKQLRAHVKEFAERAGVRITLVAPDGTVTADSFADAGMENHGGRPEIRKALEGEVAWSERANRTAQQSLVYLATPYAGGVIRLATPMAAVTEQVREIRRQVLKSTAMAIIPAALIALLFARYFSRKLAAIIGYADSWRAAISTRAC